MTRRDGVFRVEPSLMVSPSRVSPSGRVMATALLVCAAYYAGAHVGLILRLPPSVPSVLWPPNSILTATLLLAPPQRWWLYLLAALPAHLAAELPLAWPTGLVLGLFVTNCSEAVIGACCVRALSDAPTRFDTLRRVLVFVLGAGFCGPFLSSFLDAGVVAQVLGEPYWILWRSRFFSNVLTELTLVPAIVVVATSGTRWVRQPSFRDWLGSVLLSLAFAGVAAVYVIAPLDDPWGIRASPQTPVAFFLPFVLLAAVRFGSAGASLSLLLTTVIVVYTDTHRPGFSSFPRGPESVLALQLTLSVSAIPLMCLAGLISERRRSQEALAERLRFEELLSRLSGGFVHLASDQMAEAFDAGLGRIGTLLAVDRALLLRMHEGGHVLAIEHSWAARGLTPPPRAIVSDDCPWTIAALLREQPISISSPDDLPDEAAWDKASLQRQGIRSKLALPLVSGRRVFGGLVLETTRDERAWAPELVAQLQLIAEVFANALARKENEDAVRASEVMKSAILSSLNSSVGVLDREGYVIAVNQDWAHAPPHHGTATGGAGLGTNYLDVCRHASQDGAMVMTEAVAGIHAVLDRLQGLYGLEYSCRTPAGERWYSMSVVPLNRPDGGAVVSHTEITERKRAEMQAQRSRQELAHVTRVSTMGELTASLAHELNQPLTGILSNAQAARRLLDVKPPDLQELSAILTDIIEDDKRAAEVIQRLRGLLRKGEFVPCRLDLNALILEVVKLLGSDTVIRNVQVTLDLAEGSVLVSGDRVQLAQVLLNLMLNAMEAMADSVAKRRVLTVRTRQAAADRVHVSVEDTGPGLSHAQEAVFEPFYTTKPAGMGMGLAIARSIIEAHNGEIWAENVSPNGAIFHVRLPAAMSRA